MNVVLNVSPVSLHANNVRLKLTVSIVIMWILVLFTLSIIVDPVSTPVLLVAPLTAV